MPETKAIFYSKTFFFFLVCKVYKLEDNRGNYQGYSFNTSPVSNTLFSTYAFLDVSRLKPILIPFFTLRLKISFKYLEC